MTAEPHEDPRDHPLPPTQEEIEAWGAREQRRRASWLAGPSAEEKQEWARRYRWRALLGLEESRLGPAPEDIDLWAEREHRRRAAWLAGPTEAEKQRWAHERADRAEAAAPPTAEEIEAWSRCETQRRQQWLDGPSEAEKQRWAQRQSRSLFDELMSLPALLDADLGETGQRFLRDAELAGKGAVYALARVSRTLWSSFARAGRAFEDELYEQPRRRRVRY